MEDVVDGMMVYLEWRYREINRWRGRLKKQVERKERSLLNLEIGYLRNVD